MTCPVCQKAEGRPLGIHDDLAALRCPRCSFVYLDLARWTYPYADTDYYADFRLDEVRPERPHVRHRVNGVLRHRSGGRGADLGCGAGETAIAFARRGFAMQGVDESVSATTALRQAFGEVDWQCATLVEFLGRAGPLDLVTMYHVLEHIPRPAAFVELLSRRLAPGGLLVVEVPDVSGGRARRQGRRWEHWNAHHVNYFAVPTLKLLMEPHGFRLVDVERKYHFLYPQNIRWRDVAHAVLARLGQHDIVTTYWKKV